MVNIIKIPEKKKTEKLKIILLEIKKRSRLVMLGQARNDRWSVTTPSGGTTRG